MTVFRQVYPINYQSALVFDSRAETNAESCDEGHCAPMARNKGVLGRLPLWLQNMPDERFQVRNGLLHTGEGGLVVVKTAHDEQGEQLQELTRFGRQENYRTMIKRIRLVRDTPFHDNFNVGLGWYVKWWRKIEEYRQLHRSLADAETSADSNSPSRLTPGISVNVWTKVMQYLSIHDIAKLRQCIPAKPCRHPVVNQLRRQHVVIEGYSSEMKLDINALDIGVPFLDLDDPELQRVAFHCRWEDQGWGNYKGEIYAVFLKRKPQEYAEFMEELSRKAVGKTLCKDRLMSWAMTDNTVGTGFTPGLKADFDVSRFWQLYDVIHWASVAALTDRSKKSVGFELDPEQVAASDRIVLYAKSGSGGGHTLHMKNMEFVVVKYVPAWQVPGRTMEKVKRSRKVMDNILSFLKRHHQEPLLRWMRPLRYVISKEEHIKNVLEAGYRLTGHLWATTSRQCGDPLPPAQVTQITRPPVPPQDPVYRVHLTNFDVSQLHTLDNYLTAYVEVEQI